MLASITPDTAGGGGIDGMPELTFARSRWWCANNNADTLDKCCFLSAEKGYINQESVDVSGAYNR